MRSSILDFWNRYEQRREQQTGFQTRFQTRFQTIDGHDVLSCICHATVFVVTPRNQQQPTAKTKCQTYLSGRRVRSKCKLCPIFFDIFSIKFYILILLTYWIFLFFFVLFCSFFFEISLFFFYRYNYNEFEQDQKMNDGLWRSASSRLSNDHESIRHGEEAHDKYNNAAAHSSANETSGRHPTVMQWNLQVDPNSQQVRWNVFSKLRIYSLCHYTIVVIIVLVIFMKNLFIVSL